MNIKITCKPTGKELNLDDLYIMQGNLKELSEENYLKLKNSIIQKGFFCPFFVWINNDINNLLDGTQRKLTLVKMREEGFDLPEKYPIVEIEAESYTDAKEKLLAITSQYGKITQSGLIEFISDVDINLDHLNSNYNFDNIDLKNINLSMNDEELDDLKEEKEKEDKLCPHCGGIL